MNKERDIEPVEKCVNCGEPVCFDGENHNDCLHSKNLKAKCDNGKTFAQPSTERKEGDEKCDATVANLNTGHPVQSTATCTSNAPGVTKGAEIFYGAKKTWAEPQSQEGNLTEAKPASSDSPSLLKGASTQVVSPISRANFIIKDILDNHLPRVIEGLQKGYVDENQILVIYDHAVRARIYTENAALQAKKGK